jgi:hypothetical protein
MKGVGQTWPPKIINQCMEKPCLKIYMIKKRTKRTPKKRKFIKTKLPSKYE